MSSIIQDSVLGPEIKYDSRNDPHSLIVDENSEKIQPERVPTADHRNSIMACQLDEKTDILLSKDPIVRDAQKKPGNVHESSTESSASESEKVYLSGVPFVILTLVLMATILMTALDQNILCTTGKLRKESS
jgi:hypothetical protein